jgi:transcriptional regulator with XRE-family HTH domain
MLIERLDALIEERGISRYALCREVEGLTHNSLYMWERRGSVPGGNVLKSLAEYFNVSIDYLMGHSTRETTHDGDTLRIIEATRDNPNLKGLFLVMADLGEDDLALISALAERLGESGGK